ncbi:hypothetical protein SK854_01435 [Lentzea sp. BCCO 10_0061]|uniref:ATP-binding protein n=1 Tax=Lentzea sokolovensis TaxID=3095429 RepID=A0ABU4UMP5_9PSEU|nr:hypothetical protein [Lentzea sp. BCCO 10_0061]MDX8140755.1 hypothetical protein [Lentzea sp. BCCO 10_0061]
MQEHDPRLMIGATAPARSLAEVAAPHPWAIAAREHLGSSNTLVAGCVAVVSHLAAEHDGSLGALARDPWLDAEFADRFTRRLRWLTRQVLPAEALRLSDAEAALLITFPYLHQTFWARQAMTVLRGADPVAAAFSHGAGPPKFSAFAAGYGALHRRGTRAAETGDPAATGIGWWLFHQWLVRQPECYDSNSIPPLLPGSTGWPLNAVLTAPRLMELVRAVQLDPAYLRRVDRQGTLKPVARIAGGTEQEQDLREQLLGYLLVVAHRTAIDPTVLPRVIADHLGIDDGVEPGEVLTSIRAATWDGDRTRVLTTDCLHPATALALHDRAAAVDAVLTEIVRAAEDSPALAPLEHLPVHATADGTTPVASAGHRFRLADDQIQSLLMGEQLYGTPELAVRELYQNALDACRYRQARTAYLTRTGTPLPPWQGRIAFRQGVDEQGRPFLECSDNGIGMGDRELVDVFAHAGVRFTDMPEYVEEQADWARAGVESFPNSRFGIGVLSYFMLADEITVTTCRLSRSGSPGQRLEVHIAGPDALFRVRDLGPGEDAGTVVRLRLRPASKPVSCTDVLRRILWLSDFAVTSQDPGGRQSWEPRRLSESAPVGSDAPLAAQAGRTVQTVLPTGDGRVWWCDGTGAVLADGLWAGATTFGAVLDLAGHDQPRLTVDREKIIELDAAVVEARLTRRVPELVTSAGSPLSHSWLSKLAETMPRLADDICDHAIGVRYRPWRVGTTEMPIEIVGCFPSDANVLTRGKLLPHWNEHVSRWRLAAWLQAEEPDKPSQDAVVPARPSDAALLDLLSDTASLGHVVQASLTTRRPPEEVLARLKSLGVQTPAVDTMPAEVRTTDPDLLRNHTDRDERWLNHHRPVRHFEVLRAAAETGLPPSAVVKRLTELGHDIVRTGRLPAHVGTADIGLLVTDAKREPLVPDDVVPVAHVMVAAAETRQTPAQVARRLTELGYTTPDPGTLPENTDPLDVLAFVDQLSSPKRYVHGQVSRLHVVLVAAFPPGGSPAQIASRLAVAGYPVQTPGKLPQHLTSFDRAITRVAILNRPSESGPLRSLTVPVGHVITAALDTKSSPAVVAERLAELGYECPPLEWLPDDVDSDDLELVSTTQSITRGERIRHWLRTGQEVCLPHVVIVAAKRAMTPSSVASRLARFGFRTPAVDPSLTVRLEDLVLLSVNLDGEAPWLSSDHAALARSDMTVPLGHVLAASAKLGRPPAEVAARLSQVGLRSETTALPAKVARQDAELMALVFPKDMMNLPRLWEFGWLGLDWPANTRHTLFKSRTSGLAPAEVTSRLAALGFQVPEAKDLPSSIDEVDEKLLLLGSDILYGLSYRALHEPLPRSQVLRAVSSTGLSPRKVLERLERLGLEIGE